MHRKPLGSGAAKIPRRYAPRSLSAPPPRAFNHEDARIPRLTYTRKEVVVGLWLPLKLGNSENFYVGASETH